MSYKTITQRFTVAVCLGAVILLCGCKKKAQKEVSRDESSNPVMLSFEVYNHTQGFLSKYETSCVSNSPVVIGISDLDVEGVDENRVVIREERFGTLVAFSHTGIATFQAPEQDMGYTIYLMNTSSGADYRKVDTWTNANEGVLEYEPPLRWFREDRDDFQGPEDVIVNAINQLNEALHYPWAEYGRIQRIDRRKKSSFGVGYGYCRNQFGWHSPYWAGVNSQHCPEYRMRLATFIEEIFELITRLNDIGGNDTASLITDPQTGNLNGVGKDLLAYVYVKDEKI